MNNNYETLEITRIQLRKPFSDFFVQIEPTNREHNSKKYHNLILTDNASIHYYFASIPADDIDEIVTDAKILALHAIHDYIENIFPEYYYPDDEK